MSNRFTALIRTYAGQLLLLTRRILRCTPARLTTAIPLVLLNQVSFILALMLPLKVIIMLGSDKVPSYLRFLMTEETRVAWMVGLAFGALGFFVLYALSNLVVASLSRSGGARLLMQSGKAGLFDNQEQFAADLFQRVVGSWGTLGMLIGGMGVGLLLEWRLVALLTAVVLLEFFIFALYWNRFREPERASERERLAEKRADLLQNLSAFNVLIFFGGLVVLLLTEPTMNFIIALVMFILTRQILARATRIFADANYFLQNRERIDALVHPGRQLQEKRAPASKSFEQLLMPTRRSRLFSQILSEAGLKGSREAWQWRDIAGKGAALFVLPPERPGGQELRLKLKASEGDAGLAREVMFYKSKSAGALDICCEMVRAGSVFGREYLLLRSGALKRCPNKKIREAIREIRIRLWQHSADQDLASRLLRSFPALDARLTPERLGRIRVACDDGAEEASLDKFLGQWPVALKAIEKLPRVLINHALRPRNILLTDSGKPVVLSWDSIRFDVIGSDFAPAELSKDYSFETIAPKIESFESRIRDFPKWGLPLAANLGHIDRLITQEAYKAALATLPRISEILKTFDAERIDVTLARD